LVFLRETPLTAVDDRVRDFALGGSEQISSQPVSALAEPAERIRSAVRYVKGTTNVQTAAAKVLFQGSGVCQDHSHLWNVATLFRAAQVVGRALRKVFDTDGSYMKQHREEFNASIILGGQICGEQPRLFNIYTAGNFIEATPETCYFQIGEIKYGKPIIDRLITSQSTLMEGAKCTLLSFDSTDSTIRSNLSVGPPIDLLCYERDGLRVGFRRSIDDRDPYFDEIKRLWAEGLRETFSGIPDPSWQGQLDTIEKWGQNIPS
jgi:putative proteasome-type protease